MGPTQLTRMELNKKEVGPHVRQNGLTRELRGRFIDDDDDDARRLIIRGYCLGNVIGNDRKGQSFRFNYSDLSQFVGGNPEEIRGREGQLCQKGQEYEEKNILPEKLLQAINGFLVRHFLSLQNYPIIIPRNAQENKNSNIYTYSHYIYIYI